jgi:leucyl aminopeptidase
MLPTSTKATVQLKKDVPANVQAIAVLLHKDTKPTDPPVAFLPRDLRRIVAQLLAASIVHGKSNELTIQMLPARADQKPRRLMIVGQGDHKKLSVESLKQAGVTLARAARKHRLKSLALIVPPVPQSLPGLPDAQPAGPGLVLAVQSLATGLLLGNFHYQEYKGAAKKKDEPATPPITFTIVAQDRPELRQAFQRACIIADATNFVRTIASRPGNDINPPKLADLAQQLAKDLTLTCRVLDEKEIARLGMGGLLAVGSGSAKTPPRLIVLEYQPAATQTTSKISNPLLVVGKAITFDTGGISIKPADKMGQMIYDKCGGVTVLGLIYAAAMLKLPIPIVGILSAAENHISESAYRPGDIIRMYNGVTVEVTSTDAEGRLVLGDALAWGIHTYNPAAVLDLATLTGGVIVALGRNVAAVMCNNEELFNQLAQAASHAAEKIWRLPLWDEYRDQIKSVPADIVNSAGRDAQPLQGSAFLSYFLNTSGKPIPWAHLDIAGVADTDKETPLHDKGATGWGLATLVEWVTLHAQKRHP